MSSEEDLHRYSESEMTVGAAGDKLKGLQPESEHRLLEMGWVKSHPLERESGCQGWRL